MRTEQNRGPAAIVIARKNSRSRSRRKAIHFYKRFAPGEAISRSSLASAQRAGRLGGLETGASCLHLSLLVIPSSFGIRDSDFVIVRSRNSKTTMLLDYYHEQEYVHEF